MNKQDLYLILIIITICIVLYLIFNYVIKNEANKAYVYYDNDLILTIDLNVDEEREYSVDGYNGKVVIQTKKGQIRVKEEESPLHLCSKQGWVSSSVEPIICLPNKIMIKIESTDDEVDAVVR